MKVKAAVAFAEGEPLRIVELDLRGPGPGEVLIKLVATGICHSDLAVLDGHNRTLGAFPIVLGHEGAGIVAEVGAGVASVAPGDKVLVAPMVQCGQCIECLSGRSNLCHDIVPSMANTPWSYEGRPVHHYVHSGTFAEYIVLRESGVARVRDDAPLDVACVAACCVATGVGATVQAGAVKPGETVAVFGLGGIGLNAVQGARLAGASRIIGVDVNPDKEAAARKFGATDFVNSRAIEGEVSATIAAMTGGGADCTVEAVGIPELIRQALRSARMGSGRCIVVGMLPDGAALTLTADDLGAGRSLQTSAGGDFKGRWDTPRLVEWYMNGQLLFDELITGRFPLDQINLAIDELRAGRAIRSVIAFA